MWTWPLACGETHLRPSHAKDYVYPGRSCAACLDLCRTFGALGLALYDRPLKVCARSKVPAPETVYVYT